MVSRRDYFRVMETTAHDNALRETPPLRRHHPSAQHLLGAVLLALSLTACATDPATSETDADLTGACTVDPVTFPTACTTSLGRDGWCEQLAAGSDAGTCYQACRDAALGGCPAGHRADFIVGNQCMCVPNVPRGLGVHASEAMAR